VASHLHTPPRLSKDQASVSGTATAMAQPSQATKHQCCHSTSRSPATSSATNVPESCQARARFPCTKAKATGTPAVQPARTTTPTMANSRRRKRGQNASKAGTAVKIPRTFATTEWRRRRPICTEPSHGKTPARHEETNAYADRHYAYTRRNSEASGRGNCGATSSRKTGQRGPS